MTKNLLKPKGKMIISRDIQREEEESVRDQVWLLQSSCPSKPGFGYNVVNLYFVKKLRMK